jgi:hypothetical protein
MNQPASDKSKWRRLSALLIVVAGACISWALIAEYLLGIERRYWIWLPVYLVLVVLYWVPAWGAIASRAQAIEGKGVRWLSETGCLVVALFVFLVLCALLAILFM